MECECGSNDKLIKISERAENNSGKIEIYRCHGCRQLYSVKLNAPPEIFIIKKPESMRARYEYSKKVAKIISEIGYIQEAPQKILFNSECITDCKEINIIGRSKTRTTPFCGEGEYTILQECPSCNAIYLATQFCEIDNNPEEVFNSQKIKNRIPKENLIRLLSGLRGSVSEVNLEKIARERGII